MDAFDYTLSEKWLPDADACDPVYERPVAVADEYEEAVRLCAAHYLPNGKGVLVPTMLHVINLSNTTLVFAVGAGRTVTVDYPSTETETSKVALDNGAPVIDGNLGSNADISLTGRYYQSGQGGNVYVPARFSALVSDQNLIDSPQFALLGAFTQHARHVAIARAIGGLAALIPYSKLASLPGLASKVAACVLEVANSLNDHTWEMKEAISNVKTCKKIWTELRQQWADAVQKANAAGSHVKLPTSDELLVTGLKREAGKTTSVLDEIAHSVPRLGLQLLARRG